MSEVDDLLDGTLDDIDDLPEFKPYAPGANRVLASWSIEQIEGHGSCPKLSFKALENIEYANPQDATDNPVNEGDEASSLFMLDNEFGAGKFKKVMAMMQEGTGMAGSNRELIAEMQGVECILISSVKQDKTDADRQFMEIKQISVL
jgi:hypothetical protein